MRYLRDLRSCRSVPAAPPMAKLAHSGPDYAGFHEPSQQGPAPQYRTWATYRKADGPCVWSVQRERPRPFFPWARRHLPRLPGKASTAPIAICDGCIIARPKVLKALWTARQYRRYNGLLAAGDGKRS